MELKKLLKNNQIKVQEIKIIIKEMRITVDRVTGRLNIPKGEKSENVKVDL